MTIAEKLAAVVGSFSGMVDFVTNKLPIKADKPLLATTTNNTLLSGKVYNLGKLDSASGDIITLSESGVLTNECANWHFFFLGGDNAPLWAQTISWQTDPSITSGKCYEVDILKVGSVYNGLIIEKEAAQ